MSCVVFLLACSLLVAGCGRKATPLKHWFANRGADFQDIFSIGAGLSSQNEKTGIVPPSYGIYLEATTFFNIGYIRHAGGTIEAEGRGLGVYDEDREMWGFGPYRSWEIRQGSEYAHTNYYKDPQRSAGWTGRMVGDLSLRDGPVDPTAGYAKHLIHTDSGPHDGFLVYPRGWHSWEYIGIEIGIPEMLLTHHGITVRAGFDISEIIDFVGGIFFYDYLEDDRRDDE